MPTRSTDYKLYFFNARGRCETIRYLFALAKVKYEDFRANAEQFAELKLKAPFKQVPFLEVDGKRIGQSMAICRYLAREFGLAGRNNIEIAQVDSIAETAVEIREKYIPIHFQKDEAKKAEMLTEYKGTILTDRLDKLESVLLENKGGDSFFVGEKPTLADLQFYASLEFVKPAVPDALDKSPKLTGLYDRVAAVPEIADWIKKRPKTDF